MRCAADGLLGVWTWLFGASEHERARPERPTAAGYIRMMRLARAAQLLEQDAGQISEVAYRVGYRDVDHFSKIFKQVHGVVPSAYGRVCE